jgi:hypothetical protein
MMYEGTYFCDLIATSLPPGEADSACLTREFRPSACSPPEPGDDPGDYSLARDLVARIQALRKGGFYPAVERFFDFDGFLTQWAADTVISHWDSYENWTLTNYRVYHEPTNGRWTIIQTGIDQTFDNDRDAWNVGAVLARRCLDEPACEAAFAARLHAAVDLFEALDFAGEADVIYQRILADAAEDPRKPFDMATFAARHQELVDWIRARPDVVRAALQARGF